MNGILLLDKPAGLSSNAALQRVRRLLGAEKAGHVGSLDPLATGMLPLCLGEATKVAGEITAARKRYLFTVALGSRTATGDREGVVVQSAPVPHLQRASVEAALQLFRGRQMQIPPMYSALKRDGQPLYRLARAGVEVAREPRSIEISELLLHEWALPEATAPESTAPDAAALPEATAPEATAPESTAWLVISALCSKGTYIRCLAEDIARALGTCGHVASLRRLYVEPFEGQAMHTLEGLESLCGSGGCPVLMPPDQALPQLPAVHLSACDAARLALGQQVEVPQCALSGRVRLYDGCSRFMGLGEADGQGKVRPRRLFRTALPAPSPRLSL